MVHSHRPPTGGATNASALPDVPMTTTPGGGSYPTFLEPLTKNETALLEMHATIKHYEREAARIKAEEAKRRVEEANEKYRAKVRAREGEAGEEDDEEGGGKPSGGKKNKPQKKKRADNPSGEFSSEEEVDDSEDDENDADDEDARGKNTEELSRLRNDVAKAQRAKVQRGAEKEAAAEKEEAMRREMLGLDGGVKRGRGDSDDDDDYDDYADGSAMIGGPSIRKKRLHDDYLAKAASKTSLIAGLGGQSTPVHEFSKKMGMSKASLDGEVLFPGADPTPWSPPITPAHFLDGHLELELNDFDPSGKGNNTVAIKFHAPSESKRFSINFASPGHDDYNNVLFHFNPRQHQRGGQLVINDRNETMWGNAINVPLSTLPLMFGVKSCTIVVQITEEGFDVFVEGKHCARLEHRTPLPRRKGSLFLEFPSSDDNSKPENWIIYRVWWGRKLSMAADLSGVAGVDNFSQVHPRKLFISGLSKLQTDSDIDLRKAEIERAFRKYGGAQAAVLVTVQKHKTFALVEVASERQADLALSEMGHRYRLNRARRTKHEAIMEERAAAEAKKGGRASKETGDWD